MNPFIVPDAWLCRDTSLNEFLRLFDGGGEPGEVWLLNNDLALWKNDGLFRELYCEGLFGRYWDTVARIQIVLPDQVHTELFPFAVASSPAAPPASVALALTRHEFLDRLQSVRARCGVEAHWLLQKLHFGRFSSLARELPLNLRKVLQSVGRANQAWAFYVRGGGRSVRLAMPGSRPEISVPPTRAAVLVRPLTYPFVEVEAEAEAEAKAEAEANGSHHYTIASFRVPIAGGERKDWDDRISKLLEMFRTDRHWWPKVFAQLCMRRRIRNDNDFEAYTLLEPRDVTWLAPKRQPQRGPGAYVPGDRTQCGVIVANRIERETVVKAFGVPPADVRTLRDRGQYLLRYMDGCTVLLECAQGQLPAALGCYDLIHTFRPKLLCVLGSCGGYAAANETCRERDGPRVHLGDVIVASRVHMYDPRKMAGGVSIPRGDKQDLWGEQHPFHRCSWTQALDEARVHIHFAQDDPLIGRIEDVLSRAEAPDRTAAMRAMIAPLQRTRIAQVWVGQMLSGSALIEDTITRAKLYTDHWDAQSARRAGYLLGFDMEISGAVAAARRADASVGILGIKGVMDDGTGASRNIGGLKDELKDALQELATRNSADIFAWMCSGTARATSGVPGVCVEMECVRSIRRQEAGHVGD